MVIIVGKVEVNPFLARLKQQAKLATTEEVHPVEAFIADSWVELHIVVVVQVIAGPTMVVLKLEALLVVPS